MTYNRDEMLKQTIKSIVKFDNPNLEIIIGNDYTDKKISLETLGEKDKRIKIINNSKNLGEMNNMMNLLNISSGKYFTWIADDDYYVPELFTLINNILNEYNNNVFFIKHFSNELDKKKTIIDKVKLIEKNFFLNDYLSGKIKVHGCYAIFNKQFLKSINGMEILGTGFSPYSDVLLTIKACKENSIAILEDPFIFYRLHDKSVSYSSDSYTSYTSAQIELLNIVKINNLLDSNQTFKLIKTLSKDIIEIFFRSKFKFINLCKHLFKNFKYLTITLNIKLICIIFKFFIYKILKLKFY